MGAGASSASSSRNKSVTFSVTEEGDEIDENVLGHDGEEEQHGENEEELFRAEEEIYISQLPLQEKLRYLELRRIFEDAETTGDPWTRRTRAYQSLPFNASTIITSSIEDRKPNAQNEKQQHLQQKVNQSKFTIGSYEFVKPLKRTCIRGKDGQLIPLPEESHPPSQGMTNAAMRTKMIENLMKVPSSSSQRVGKSQRLSINTKNTTPGHDAEHLSYTPTKRSSSFRKGHPLSPCIKSLFEKHNIKIVRKDRLRKPVDAHKQPLVIKLIPPLNTLQTEEYEDIQVRVSLTNSQYLRMNFASISECECITTSNNDDEVPKQKRYTGKIFLHSLRPFSEAVTTQLVIGDEILEIDKEVISSLCGKTNHGVDSDGYITTKYGDKIYIENPLIEWQKAFDTEVQTSMEKVLHKAASNTSSVPMKIRRYKSVYSNIEKYMGDRHKHTTDKTRSAAIDHVSDTVSRVDSILSL